MGGRTGDGVAIRNIRYQALPSQKLFHQSTARFKGFSGPIGSGKSQALCQEAIRLSYVNAGRTGLLGAPTYPMLRDATQRSLLEILDDNAIPYDLNKSENVLSFRETGSKIFFRPVEEAERLRGMNLAWFGVDELTYCPEEAWTRLEGRLRDPKASKLCGFGVWTPKGPDWVWKRFIRNRVDGYDTIVAKAFENRHVLDRVPDFYERLRHSYDERFFAQEALGEYVNARDGLVYHAFDRLKQVKQMTVTRDRPLLWALDFNVDPMASVVAQVIDGEVRVIDEIVLSRATTEQACEEFENRFGGHPAGVVVYGDASGNRRQTTGSSDYQIIRKHFGAGVTPVQYRVPKANPLVRERVNLVNGKLCSADGEYRLWLDPKCRELIRDFEEVQFVAGSTVIDKDKDPRRTHVSDALGYLVWQECRPKAAAGEQGYRLF